MYNERQNEHRRKLMEICDQVEDKCFPIIRKEELRQEHIEKYGYISLKYEPCETYELKMKLRDNELFRQLGEELNVFPYRLYRLNL